MEGLLLLLLLLPGLLAEWTEWPEADRSPSPDFLFPDQLPRLRKALPAIAAGPVPRGCGAGREFCEVVEDYPDPAALRRKVASSMGRLEADMVFSPLREGEVGEVRARLRGQPSAADPGADSSARGAFSSESPACDSMQSFVYPRTARNAGRQWRFVVNVPGEEEGEESYVQAVKVERCLREGQACNMATAGYDTTVCRSKGERLLRGSFETLLWVIAKVSEVALLASVIQSCAGRSTATGGSWRSARTATSMSTHSGAQVSAVCSAGSPC